jgi:biotin carboxylase
VAERQALPHPLAPATAALTVSKLKQRERFRAAAVPQPAFAVCRSPDEAEAAAGRLGFPCVVKAPDRQGQRGLALVLEHGDVRPAAEAALRASRGGSLIVEQYALGREVTVNAFSVGGRFFPLTITDREVADPPAFGVALAHVWPSALPPRQIGLAVEAAGAAARALGVTDGPTYTQILATADGPRVAELAARLGGGHDAELCRAALGVDLNGLALSAALGEAVQPPEPRATAGGACTAFLVPPAGELLGLEGVEEAARSDGVVRVRLYRRPGFRFGEFRVGPDRAGAVLAVGESKAEAYDRARAAAALIRFQTDAALV